MIIAQIYKFNCKIYLLDTLPAIPAKSEENESSLFTSTRSGS